MKQHESLEQLNLQAHQSAQQSADEYVLEAFLTFDKLKLLVHELLVIEAWRVNVFPRIKQGLVELKATMRGYFCLFHEATLINLLAVCMHHSHAVEALGEDAVELVDYLARRLVDLNQSGREWAMRGADNCDDRFLNMKADVADGGEARLAKAHAEAARLDKQTPLQSLEDQAVDVMVQVSVGAVTLMRYLCEHVNGLPLSVLVRILETHDILCSIIPIIENPPWSRRLKKSGVWQKLVDNTWEEVGVNDLLKLTKTEGQVWLALFSLVCNNEVRKRYHFNSFRKGQLLRARKYMNEVLLDQLPVLADVQRFIDELALMDVSQPTAEQGGSSVLRMEQVGATQEKLKRRNWEDVAARALGVEGFGAQSDATDADLRRLIDNVYALDGVDDVLNSESEATKVELYSQPLSSLDMCILSGEGHLELVRVSYVLAAGEANRIGKATPTDQGDFLRRRWIVPKESIETEPSCADVPFSSCASSDTVADMLPCVLKAELSFTGMSPITCAVASQLVVFDSAEPQKRWVQLGAIKEKIAIQVQLVRDTQGAPFRVADAFISTPSP